MPTPILMLSVNRFGSVLRFCVFDRTRAPPTGKKRGGSANWLTLLLLAGALWNMRHGVFAAHTASDHAESTLEPDECDKLNSILFHLESDSCWVQLAYHSWSHKWRGRYFKSFKSGLQHKRFFFIAEMAEKYLSSRSEMEYTKNIILQKL